MRVIRLLLLGIALAAGLGGCYAKYESHVASSNVATLSFPKYEGLHAGVTYFSAVSDPKCKSNEGRLATAGPLHAEPQPARVLADAPIFIVGQWFRAFGTGCPSTPTPPNTISMCLNSCTVVGSFVPATGARYEVAVNVNESAGKCRLTVQNLNASAPVRVSTYPTAERCKKV